MLRTAVLSAGLALLGWLSASWVTEGFQVWTAEGARRLVVIDQPIAAPAAVLTGPGMAGRTLPDVLAGNGHVTIVDFIYTRCTSVCSALGGSLQQLQTAIESNRLDGVSLLSISFDPAYDDASHLLQYASRWGADPDRWRFASVPDQGELQRLLDAFQVVVIPDGLGGYEHNAALLVIDERGRLVRIFDDNEGDAALAYASSLVRQRRQGAGT